MFEIIRKMRFEMKLSEIRWSERKMRSHDPKKNSIKDEKIYLCCMGLLTGAVLTFKFIHRLPNICQ